MRQQLFSTAQEHITALWHFLSHSLCDRHDKPSQEFEFDNMPTRTCSLQQKRISQFCDIFLSHSFRDRHDEPAQKLASHNVLTRACSQQRKTIFLSRSICDRHNDATHEICIAQHASHQVGFYARRKYRNVVIFSCRAQRHDGAAHEHTSQLCDILLSRSTGERHDGAAHEAAHHSGSCCCPD